MKASISLVVQKENYIYVKYWDKMAEVARRDGEHEQESRMHFNLLKCLWEELINRMMWPRPPQVSLPVDRIDLTSPPPSVQQPCRPAEIDVLALMIWQQSWRVWTCLVVLWISARYQATIRSVDRVKVSSDQTHTDPPGSPQSELLVYTIITLTQSLACWSCSAPRAHLTSFWSDL